VADCEKDGKKGWEAEEVNERGGESSLLFGLRKEEVDMEARSN
jgi:hypothetical protein